MLFELSRVLLFVLLAALILYLTKGMKKWIPLLLCLLGFCAVSLTSIWPVENLFIDFKTPEKALSYYAAGEFINGEIRDIEEGRQTCMVLHEERPHSYKMFIFPKTEEGYKLPYFYGKKQVVQSVDGNGAYTVYNYESTDDYYLFATFFADDENITIIDSCGKQIDPLIKDIPHSDLKSVFVLSFIDEFTDDYSVTVNGETVKLNQAD